MRLATLDRITLPNFSVLLMTGLLGELGIDPAPMLAAAGVPSQAVDDPRGHVTGRQELAVQRGFHDRVPDRPDLWVELGSRYRLLSYAHEASALGAASAPTLRALFDFSMAFDHLNYTLAAARLVFAGDRLAGFETSLHEVPEDIRQFTMLRDIAATLPIFRDVWGGGMPPVRLETGVSPAHAAHIPPSFEVTLSNREGTLWQWSTELDDRPLPHGNPLLFQRSLSECGALVSAAMRHDPLGPLDQLLERDPRLPVEKAASALGLSTRTLQRRLAEAGMTYRGRVEHERHRRACAMLRQDRGPITDIAWQTGYQNVTSFNHAFRRLAGMSPSAYRRLGAEEGLSR